MRVPHIAGCNGRPPTVGCPGCIAYARPRISSRRRARTANQRDLFAAGVHPATGRTIDRDHRCGDCASCSAVEFAAASTRYKCDEHLAGRIGSHTDIRLSWPACALFRLSIAVLAEQ